MSNIHATIVQIVKINQELNKVKYVTNEIGNVNPPTHPEFVIGSVNLYRHHRITQWSMQSKLIMSLKSAADTIQFTTQKVMWISTGPLMRIYKPNIYPFKKYRQMKATFYTYPLYRKVP